MGSLLTLAEAAIPDDLIDQVDHVGWFLPFLGLVIPVSLILFFVVPRLLFAALLLAQLAGVYFGLRAVFAHLRRTGFNSYQVKIMLGPLYLVACFATNLVVLLIVGIIHKFF